MNLFLGKHPVLDFDNEKWLVAHVQKLEAAGFPVTRDMIRRLAFEFAEKLGIEQNFDKETRKAGPHWLQSFLERNPELSVRQAEGLSLARAQGLNREEVNKMFELLLQVLIEHDLLDKPDHIFNIDETGVQLSNKPGKVIATKGAKSVHSVTSREKGETMSIIACCNAAGNFLPPVVIIKGANKKPEFHDGLPPGSDVYMSKKSAYVNAELFQKWLVQHFVPRKPQGKVLLILDGHSSHTNSAEMLETAEENGLILFCLPSHSTQALQPLDRSFFKPFKTFYAAETQNWMLANKEKKISRSVAGRLIGNAWIRAATPSNAISGFKACGIWPYNPAAVPESFFAISDLSSSNQVRNEQENVSTDKLDGLQLPGPSCSNQTLSNLDNDEARVSPTLAQTRSSSPPNPDPIHETSGSPNRAKRDPPNSPSLLYQQPSAEIQKDTPSKYLQECSPVPKIPVPLYKRGKQSAAVLTSKENIAATKNKGKATPNIPCKSSKQPRKVTKKRSRAASEETCASDDSLIENEFNVVMKKTKEQRATKTEIYRKKSGYKCEYPKHNSASCSQSSDNKKIGKASDEKDETLSNESDSSLSATNKCAECFEDFEKTKSKVDWIQCVMCKKWLHETCTMYGDYCNQCQRLKLRQEKKIKNTKMCKNKKNIMRQSKK